MKTRSWRWTAVILISMTVGCASGTQDSGGDTDPGTGGAGGTGGTGTGGSGGQATGGAGGSGSTASNATRTCDALIGRQTDCVSGITPEQVEAATADCVARLTAAAHWSEAFVVHLEECCATLDCADASNVDDICFGQAITDANQGRLSVDVVSTCIADSAGCEALVNDPAFASEAGPSADCLRRWVECKPEGPFDPFWSEDHCLSFLALDEAAVAEVGACVFLACSEVTQCLTGWGAFNF